MRCPRETEVLSSGLRLCKSHRSKLENLHRNVLSLLPWSLTTKKALAPPLGHPYHQNTTIQGRSCQVVCRSSPLPSLGFQDTNISGKPDLVLHPLLQQIANRPCWRKELARSHFRKTISIEHISPEMTGTLWSSSKRHL